MLKSQRNRTGILKAAVFALLAGAAGCSDDYGRLNAGLTTASLGIEPSNQDRIIRKAGSGELRSGVRPAEAPQQAYPGEETASGPSAPAVPKVTYAAPIVASDSLPPLKPAQPAAFVAEEAETVEPVAVPERTVRSVEEAPLARTSSKGKGRKVSKPKLAAAGIPVVPPVPSAPGRLKQIGEPIHTGSVSTPVDTSASIAAGDSYVVISGDTLYGIARRSGISASALSEANGLSGSALSIGQRLVIPSGPNQTASVRVKETPSAPIVSVKEVVTSEADEVVTGSVPREKVVKTAAAPKPAIAAPSTTAAFSWPARGRILSSFGQRTAKGSNDGVDIALPEGTAIRAAADGIVLYSGSELKDFGNLVLVRHDDGWVSAYANASSNLVQRGDRVTRGQTIAKSGKSGNATQPQLHFELRRNSKPIDPERFLKG